MPLINLIIHKWLLIIFDMDPKVILEKYLLTHPEYWEFEDEVKEVRRLKTLIENELPSCFPRLSEPVSTQW
jgi:hypothetical protein